MSPHGHRRAGSKDRAEADGNTPRGALRTRAARPRPPPCRPLRNDSSDDRDAFRRATTDRVSPGAGPRLPPFFEARRDHTHRSRLRVAVACVSTSCGILFGQRRVADSPCGLSCVTTRDASDRLLPSHVFVRAPAPRRFPMRHELALAPMRTIACITSARSASAGHTSSIAGFTACGRSLPLAVRVDRASGTPVASPSVVVPLARSRTLAGAAETATRAPAWTMRVGGRSEMPSIGRGPLPRDALSSARLWPSRHRGLATANAGCRRLCTRADPLRDSHGPGPRPRAPLPAGITLL